MFTFCGLTAYLEVVPTPSLYSQLASEIEIRFGDSFAEPETVVTRTLETTDEGFRGLPFVRTNFGVSLA